MIMLGQGLQSFGMCSHLLLSEHQVSILGNGKPFPMTVNVHVQSKQMCGKEQVRSPRGRSLQSAWSLSGAFT